MASRAGARGACRLAAIAVLGVLAVGAPTAALHAAGGTVPIEDIEIVGTPKLFVERPGTGAGYNAAWVVFQTRPHLHVARQVVVELRGLRGNTYSSRGAPNCIRATVIHAASVVKPGARYRVRFYGREHRAGKADTLVATHTLVAHRFDTPRSHPSSPRCGS
jgi:hypothetical protein